MTDFKKGIKVKTIFQYTLLLCFMFLYSCGKTEEEKPPPVKEAAVPAKDEKVIRLSTVANVDGLRDIIQNLQEAYAKIGFKVEIVNMPAIRALNESNSGKIVDGEVARTLFAQKFIKNQIRIPVSLGKLDISAFVKKLDIKINGWESLKGYNITSVRGYWLIQDKLQHISHLSEVADAAKALTFLEHERTDIAVLIKKTGLQVLKDMNGSGIKVLEPPIDSLDIYHFIHEKHKDLVPALTRALSEVTGREIEK